MPDCVKVYPSFDESFLTFISPFFLTGMFRLGSCTITNPAEHAIDINNTRDNKTLLSQHESVQGV